MSNLIDRLEENDWDLFQAGQHFHIYTKKGWYCFIPTFGTAKDNSDVRFQKAWYQKGA